MGIKLKHIPVNSLPEDFVTGITIKRVASNLEQSLKEADYSHRHDYHIFLLAEKGSAQLEIDFEKYQIVSHSILYIHPSQVHRILTIEQADFYLLGIRTENINPKYQALLEDITPAKPLKLNSESFSILSQALSLCSTVFERSRLKLYPTLLQDCCNILVALFVSQYLEQTRLTDKLSRFQVITKDFRVLLERHFTSLHRPSDYAGMLHLSTAYLNECVRNATGFSVSHHIQQRIILEAKRLLYHSDKSVKEIAADLGFGDYAYFSRLFTKATGMTALTFRYKNPG